MSMSDADRQKLSVTFSTIGACPYSRAKRMKHYVTNGLKFRTKDSEKNKKTQNSGLSVVTNGGVAYYVIVTNIIELNYSNKIRHVLFKCKWVDVLSIRGYKIDELGFPLVNFTRLIHVGDELMDEPYVLASEASQVFYVEDKRDKDWFVVVKTKARDVFDAGNGRFSAQDDDGDTYYENFPYNIISDNVASDNIGLARPDVQGTTIDAMVIEENEKKDGDFIDDNDFIDDEVSDEEYNDNEYNDD